MSSGMSMGKLRTAIKLTLFPALAAMAETMVRMLEKPMLARESTNTNRGTSWTILRMNKLYNTNVARPNSQVMMAL